MTFSYVAIAVLAIRNSHEVAVEFPFYLRICSPPTAKFSKDASSASEADSAVWKIST